MTPLEGRYLTIDGLRTHYLEAGEGEPVVLIHSGEFGASAELSWELMLPLLADRFRVVAPDLLGFGHSAKVHDFESGYRRRTAHLAKFLATLGIDEAHLVGTSMGGTLLLRDQTADAPTLPARSLTLMSSGGAMLDNEARRTLLDYDCTFESMRRVVRVLFHDESWSEDDAYVKRRVDSSLVPGAWECAAAARLKPPTAPARTEFGQPDSLRYERIEVPVLIVAGADDPLKESGYAVEVGRRIPLCEVAEIEACAHCPNLEHPQQVSELLVEFLSGRGQLLASGAIGL